MTASVIIPSILALYNQVHDADERKKIISALQEMNEDEDERFRRIKAKIDSKYPNKRKVKTLSK